MASSTEPATPHLPPRRNPMSKLALMLVGVFGLICLACCGGTWFVDQSSEHEEFTDVASVTAVAPEEQELFGCQNGGVDISIGEMGEIHVLDRVSRELRTLA